MADNLKMAKNLFAAVEDALFFGDRLTTSEFACLMQPGRLVSSNLDEGNLEDMAIQADLTNQAIDTSFLYLPITTSTISQKYYDVLNFAALPNASLSPSDIQEINQIRDWLADHKAAYDIGRDRYGDAKRAYEFEANKLNPSSAELEILAQKRDDALNDWETFGLRSLYENKVGRLIQITAGNPDRLWNDFRTLLASNRKSAPKRGGFYQTFFVPSVKTWNSPETSWGYYQKHVSERDTYSYSHTTNWSAGASGGWGLFSVDVGTGGSSEYKRTSSDVTDVTVKFEYARIRISRPWLIPDAFGYQFWTWKKTYGRFRYLSDGGILSANPPIRPIGMMPALPTDFVLARNVELTANFSHNDQTLISSQLSGSASAGWACFSFNGSYSESTSEQIVHASFDGTTIKISQPQIIAFISGLMPKTPDPDQTLPFGSDAQFPQDTTKDDVALIKDVRWEDYAWSVAEGAVLEQELANRTLFDLSQLRKSVFESTMSKAPRLHEEKPKSEK